ncbi:U5 small nuclear ribonucleoprotein 40 kDa protein [Bienertia sinuspersici]
MAHFGPPMRRRELEFLQFMLLMINIVVLAHLMSFAESRALCNSVQFKITKRLKRKMEESSASGGGRGKNKRFWTNEEDKALVAALHELSSDPHWKCENGFRNGYMIRLEEVISKAMPGCGLKATPHIDSRLKTLVSKFRAILAMLETSGFKWDDERQMISVERTVYEEYCKAHPTAKNLYGVPFPHLHLMMDIYGKDYATGKIAEGFQEAVEKLQDQTEQVLVDSSEEDNGVGTIESAPPLKRPKTEKSNKKKGSGKIGANTSSSEGTLQQFMKDMNVHLSTMANVWARVDGREQDLSDKCNNVLIELLQLDGIVPGEAFEAANILSAHLNKLTIFYNCPGDLKKQYVKSLLGSGDGNSF